jgi:hypothetical protein
MGEGRYSESDLPLIAQDVFGSTCVAGVPGSIHSTPAAGYPDQMQMDLEYGTRGASLFCHPTSLICGARAEAVA